MHSFGNAAFATFGLRPREDVNQLLANTVQVAAKLARGLSPVPAWTKRTTQRMVPSDEYELV